MPWIRRSLVTGLVVAVPLIISVAAFVWLFQFVDGVMGPAYARWLGRNVPGLGLLTLLVLVVIIGAVANNVLGNRVLRAGEAYLLRLPVFRAIYVPVKQLVAAFSPDSEVGFKQVVLIDDPRRGRVLGFLTKEFVLDCDGRREALAAVYVPTNHIYFGDIHVYPAESVTYPDLTVPEGVQIFLTGGMAIPARLQVPPDAVAVDRSSGPGRP